MRIGTESASHRGMRLVPLLLPLLIAAACGGGTSTFTDGGPGGGDDAATQPDAPAGFTVRDRARALAQALRGNGNFMVGVGNDNSGPYDNNVPIDLHYAYLDGYGDQGGWTTWNPDGMYATYFAQNAESHGATPMFTYYQLALELENNNDAVLNDSTRMHQYLADIRTLFQRLADTGQPAALYYEPDFFGYLMQRAANGMPPDQIPAKVHFDDVPECASLDENVAGLIRCVVHIGRAVAPMVKIGYHASSWGAWYDDTDPNADVEGSAQQVADFLDSVGAADTDFVGVETLDRDAGFWETDGGGSTCSVTDGSRGAVYWDESNQTLPDFATHVRWVAALTDRLQRPAIWWQTPFGDPSDSCGGSDTHWRDDRVHYFFSHVSDLVDAGSAGMTFGTGAGGQTTLETDSDHFKDAATAYMAAPFAL